MTVRTIVTRRGDRLSIARLIQTDGGGAFLLRHAYDLSLTPWFQPPRPDT
jgi:hypothetical protein